MGSKILVGNNMEKLKEIESESVDCIVSSPPYFGLRDYGVDGQFGLEETLEEYIEKTVLLFEELRRVLKPQGTVWWNLGDSYANKSSAWGGRGKNSILNDTGLEDKQRRNTIVPKGLKTKDLMMIPARVAIALSENGWYLRSEIIWHKPNPMPESVKDRPTSAHEKIYLFAKNKKYYYDADAIRVPQKTESIKRAHRDRWEGSKMDSGNYSIPNVDSAKKAEDKVRDTVAEGKIPMANKRNVWSTKYESDEEERMYRQGMSKTRGENAVFVRTKLPTQKDFVKFMRERTSIKQLDEETDIKKTKIEHWFRNDESGFAFPSVEDWKVIKDYVNDWSKEFELIDEGLTYVESHLDSIESNPLGKNKRNVWTVTTKPFKGAHFAVFPQDLIEPCIKAGCPEKICFECGKPYIKKYERKDNNKDYIQVKGINTPNIRKGGVRLTEKGTTPHFNPPDIKFLEFKKDCKCETEKYKSGTVLDPFGGSGTTGLVANNLGRDAILIELNEEYVEIAKKRIGGDNPLFSEVEDG